MYTLTGYSKYFITFHLKTRSITAAISSGIEMKVRIFNAKQLYAYYLSKARVLISDGTIEETELLV